MPVLYSLYSGQTNTSNEGQQHENETHQQASQNDHQQDEKARKAASIRAQEVVGLGSIEDVGKNNPKPQSKPKHASIVPAVALTILCVVILALLVAAVFVWHPDVLKGRALIRIKGSSDKALQETQVSTSKSHVLDAKAKARNSNATNYNSKSRKAKLEGPGTSKRKQVTKQVGYKT